jgi:hypothetical protein
VSLGNSFENHEGDWFMVSRPVIVAFEQFQHGIMKFESPIDIGPVEVIKLGLEVIAPNLVGGLNIWD